MDTTLPEKIDLQVVTPEYAAVSATVTSVSLPGAGGRLGILPGHAPLVSELRAGTLSYETSGSQHYLAVGRGFVEVLPGRVIVLTGTAERAEDLDLERAQEARRRAEDALKKTDGAGAESAREALERAAARVETAAQAKRG